MSSVKAKPARRGRPPRGSELLSRQRVLEAALALVDEEGLDAISMRKLALRLDVDPMSFYNHVDGKDALLDGIAEMMLSSIGFPETVGDSEHKGLRESMEVMARKFRQAMLDHPRAAPVVLTRQLPSIVALAPIEAVIGPLLAAGYPSDKAVHALRSVLAFLIGALMREVGAAPTFSASDSEASRQREADLRASGLPAVMATAAHLAVIDHETEFEFGLALLLDSLDNQLRP